MTQGPFDSSSAKGQPHTSPGATQGTSRSGLHDERIARGEGLKVSAIEGQQFVTLSGPRTHQMQRIVNRTAAQTLMNCQGKSFRIVLGGERNDLEMGEHRLLEHPVDIGGWKPRLQWKRGQGGKEFCQAMSRHHPVKLPLLDRQQPGKGPDMVRVLLQQRRDRRGSVETGFLHDSNPAELPTPLLAFLVQKGSDIPGGRGELAGADQKAILRGQG